MPDLTIVIVNYRTAGLTIDCLASIVADPSLPSITKVMVVDAVSGDGSGGRIARAIEESGCGDRIGFADLERNGGFAFGNNAAIAAADARWGRANYYLLLNPDTVVRPGALGALTHFMDEHPHVGIAGSSLEDPDGTRQACSFRFPTAMSELESEARLGPVTQLLGRWRVVLPTGETPHEADWVSGASMIVRREVFDQIGNLDEGYFLYFEELDFCRRAVQAGWQCWTVPESRIVHLCGQSTGVSSKGEKVSRRPAYWFNSRNRYFNKHHGRIGSLVADAGWLTGQGIWKLRSVVQRRPNLDPPFLVRDFMSYRASRK